MTATGTRLIPGFEAGVQLATGLLGITGLHAGNVVPVDDPDEALPLGDVRKVRAGMAHEVGLDVVIALIADAADAVCAFAGAGDDLVGALMPTMAAVLAGIGSPSGTPLEPGEPAELDPGTSLSMPGTEAFTAGLFVDDEQIGNLVFFASPGALIPADSFSAPSFPDARAPEEANAANPLSLLRGVEMRVTAELGRTRLPVSHVLDLGPGAVVELDRVAGAPVDVLVNGTVIAHGEVVVIDEEYGVRITEIVGSEDS